MSRPLTRAEAIQREELIKVEEYVITLDLTDARDQDKPDFGVHAVITFGCRRPGADTFIEIAPTELAAAHLNGRPLDLDSIVDDRLPLPNLASENRLEVRGRFGYSTSREGLHRFVDPTDGETYLYTMTFLDESKRIYPCFDQPDLKARFRFRVLVPAGWTAISNAASEYRTRRGSGLEIEFAPTEPIPSYIAALAAGPFHAVTTSHNGLPLGLHCRQSLIEQLNAEELFDLTRSGLDFYSTTFGVPYPFVKYDQIFVPEFGAGVAMENAAATFFSDDFLFPTGSTPEQHRERAETVLHELAHMWFGNLVTTRWWDDTWLNESFASFAATVALDRACEYPDPWVWFAQSYKAAAYSRDQLSTTHPVSADIDDTRDAVINFDHITYNKGASVLKQLVAYVGEESFWAGISTHLREHAWGNAELSDLLAALAKHSGRDLDDWTASWLQTSGVNLLRLEVDHEPDGSIRSAVVRQEVGPGHPQPRTHRIGLGVYRPDGNDLRLDERLEFDVAGPLTELPQLKGTPGGTTLLLNDGDLAYTKIKLDPDSFASLLAGPSRLPDPLATAHAWSTLWDLTCDGELDPAEFAALAMADLPKEQNRQVVEATLGHVRNAVRRFLADAESGWALLASTAARQLDNDPAHHQSWLDLLIDVEGGTEQQPMLVSMHQSGTDPTGVPLSFEQRWRLLTELAAVGLADKAEIKAEQAKAPGALADRRAMTVLAARQDPAAKLEAWTMITTGAEPLALRRAAVDGFWHRHHDQLTVGYLESYFAGLTTFWNIDDGGQQAVMLSDEFFPVGVRGPVAAMATDWLTDPSRPAAQRTVIAGKRDLAGRAERVRSRFPRRDL